MPAIPALLFLTLASASPAAPDRADDAGSPVLSLLAEGIAATEAAARFRVAPPAGALVAIADGDGDGLQDVVVVSSRARASWFLRGDGKGGFGPIEKLDLPRRVQGTGELDGDAAPEQLYASVVGAEVVLLPGKPGPASPAATADLDGDGVLDLVRVEGGTLRVSLSESGREERVPVGPDVVSLATMDLDHDGALDLLVADAHADAVSLFLGDGRGGLRPAGGHRVWVRPFSMATGDMDADGALDLLVSDQCGSTMALLRGTGSGAFAEPILVTPEAGEGPRPAGEKGLPGISSVSLSETRLLRGSGATSTVTVVLDRPAPAEGWTVRLRSSDPELVALPREVSVAAGETRATASVAADPGQRRRGRLDYVVTVTATSGDGSAGATLTLTAD